MIPFSVQEYDVEVDTLPLPWSDCMAMCASKIYIGMNCNVYWFKPYPDGTGTCALGTYPDITALVDRGPDAINAFPIRVLKVKKALP